jgi:hypothetical protein
MADRLVFSGWHYREIAKALQYDVGRTGGTAHRPGSRVMASAQ